MEGKGRAQRGRVARASGVLSAHKPSTTIPGHCLCGFRIPGWETIEDHRARMIVGELFSTQIRDRAERPARPHPGGAENLAMHRALGEPPCTACLTYMDQVMDEGRRAHA